MNSLYLENFSQYYKEGVKSYLARDLKTLKKCILRCTDSSEKKLLLIREHILEQNSEAAMLVALSLSEYFPHIKAEKHLQLASIYSIGSQHEKAIASNLRVLPYFRSMGERTRTYAILYNLSVDASLLRLRELSNVFLDQAQEIASGPEEFLEIARSKACNYSQEGNFSKALSILEKIKENIHQAPRLEGATFCMVAADICVRANKLELAQNYLSNVSMKKNYSYFNRAQIQKRLLDFLCNKKTSLRPQKLYPLHKSNEYLLQWNTLIHIQNGELQEAQNTWSELSKQRPRVYGSFLKTVEPIESLSLFSRCLSKVLPAEKPNAHIENIELTGKLKLAYDLFVSTPTPLRKEELIEKLWNVHYSSEFDSRFYKLIERLKSRIPHKLIQKNRAYILSH